MGWDPWSDVTDFFEDYWESDFFKIAAPAVIGGVIAGPAGFVAGASLGYSSVQQKSAIKKAEKLQEKQIAAQREMLGRQAELAGQQYTLTEKQMQLQVGQRQIELLANLFTEQDRTEPQIYTLPTAEPTSPIERINLAIEDFFNR